MDPRRQLYEELKQRPRRVLFEELRQLMELWNFDLHTVPSGRSGLFSHRTYGKWAGGNIPSEQSVPVIERFVEQCFEAIEEIIGLEEGANGHH